MDEVISQMPDIGNTIFTLNYKFAPTYIAWYKASKALGLTPVEKQNMLCPGNCSNSMPGGLYAVQLYGGRFWENQDSGRRWWLLQLLVYHWRFPPPLWRWHHMSGANRQSKQAGTPNYDWPSKISCKAVDGVYSRYFAALCICSCCHRQSTTYLNPNWHMKTFY